MNREEELAQKVATLEAEKYQRDKDTIKTIFDKIEDMSGHMGEISTSVQTLQVTMTQALSEHKELLVDHEKFIYGSQSNAGAKAILAEFPEVKQAAVGARGIAAEFSEVRAAAKSIPTMKTNIKLLWFLLTSSALGVFAALWFLGTSRAESIDKPPVMVQPLQSHGDKP